MNTESPRIGWLFWLSAVSLAVALAIRLYAAGFLVSVSTWDDNVYRNRAGLWANRLSTTETLGQIFLPNPRHPSGDGRTMGYYLWLALGLKLFRPLGAERALQLLNVILLGIQLLCVYGFAIWALRDAELALAITALYLLTPIVFGLNRWVLSENHIMAGVWAIMYATTWLVSASRPVVHLRRRQSDIIRAIAAGVTLGAFSTLREYALPFVTVLYAVTCVALIVDRRPLAASVFFAVATPYLACAFFAAQEPFRAAANKMLDTRYLHPLAAWLRHAIMEAWGPAMTIIVVSGVLFVLVLPFIRFGRALFGGQVSATLRRLTHVLPRGLFLLCLTHAALFAITVALLIHSNSRVMRAAVLMMIFCSTSVLLGWRLLNPVLGRARRAVTFCLGVALLASWGVQYHQLWVRFDHGRAYVVHPTNMEYYNHPLWLRDLVGPEDRHYIAR